MTDTFDRPALQGRLMHHEGFKGLPYTDTEGHLTILYGHNLETNPLSVAAGLFVLNEDIDEAAHALFAELPWTAQLDPVRQAVYIEFSFAMGMGTLLQFKMMNRAAMAKNWPEAALQLLSSKWADEVGTRAKELAYALRTGQWQAA